MQGGRGGGDPFFDFGGPFAGAGGFGGHRSLLSNFFGGRDPFDDPFFTRPFGGMLESSFFGPTGNPFMGTHPSGFIEHQAPQARGPIIEELNSDDETEEGNKEKKDKSRKHGRSNQEPYVDHPEDEVEERKSKQIQYNNALNSFNNRVSHPQSGSFTFQSSSVTYGGSNGAYYTSSRMRRSGSDGLTIEEAKEADSTTGKAAHRLSRGIHDKGHTVARKLNSDGRVDTMQTLHNINEDELVGFEEAWKGNARKHLPGWTDGFNLHHGGMGSGVGGQNGTQSRGGWALPSNERPHNVGSMKPDTRDRAGSSRSQESGRLRANIGEKVGSSRGKSKTAGTSKMDHIRRR
ncbi:hypothetical protein RJ639_029791 [Escallonia herrerae]|uniref:Myeloid leukemia factor 1 n=1 Tax=Escallonia herrerae TaxID=1293975 RepID=A0AA88X254_9ASTE|nr:hypothetical protein RJ639_029791 [Escallonia herrerae]